MPGEWIKLPERLDIMYAVVLSMSLLQSMRQCSGLVILYIYGVVQWTGCLPWDQKIMDTNSGRVGLA